MDAQLPERIPTSVMLALALAGVWSQVVAGLFGAFVTLSRILFGTAVPAARLPPHPAGGLQGDAR